jgi:O-antigen/teichoic acid export membrane protein
MLVGAFINIVLNYALIRKYGIDGASLGTAISIIVWNIIGSLYVYKIYNEWIGYLPFIKKR